MQLCGISRDQFKKSWLWPVEAGEFTAGRVSLFNSERGGGIAAFDTTSSSCFTGKTIRADERVIILGKICIDYWRYAQLLRAAAACRKGTCYE